MISFERLDLFEELLKLYNQTYSDSLGELTAYEQWYLNSADLNPSLKRSISKLSPGSNLLANNTAVTPMTEYLFDKILSDGFSHAIKHDIIHIAFYLH
jgi:hypothetical protein